MLFGAVGEAVCDGLFVTLLEGDILFDPRLTTLVPTLAFGEAKLLGDMIGGSGERAGDRT
jgi:hypothetical protein